MDGNRVPELAAALKLRWSHRHLLRLVTKADVLPVFVEHRAVNMNAADVSRVLGNDSDARERHRRGNRNDEIALARRRLADAHLHRQRCEARIEMDPRAQRLLE